jgi:hypothetical protein
MLNHQGTSRLAAYICELRTPLVGVVNEKDTFRLTSGIRSITLSHPSIFPMLLPAPKPYPGGGGSHPAGGAAIPARSGRPAAFSTLPATGSGDGARRSDGKTRHREAATADWARTRRLLTRPLPLMQQGCDGTHGQATQHGCRGGADSSVGGEVTACTRVALGRVLTGNFRWRRALRAGGNLRVTCAEVTCMAAPCAMDSDTAAKVSACGLRRSSCDADPSRLVLQERG